MKMAASKSSGSAATTTGTAARPRRAAATAARSVDTSGVPLSDKPGTADTAGLKADQLIPAANTDMEASGAFQEPEIKERIDASHPAVDNAPRAGQPARSNRIDFNDPTKTDAEAVAENLKAQG
jgi:hypothetical protein